MQTKFNSGDKVWVPATIRKAEEVKGKIYYTIDESEYIVPEDICQKCSDEDNDALTEYRRIYQCAITDKELGYSTCHSPLLP